MTSNTKHAEKARHMLKKAAIRHTMPRVAVLSALLAAHRPVSAEQLVRDLADFQADEVTIYRILRLFAERGLAHQVDIGDRVWRFASCGDEGHQSRHAHFACRKCGELECLDAASMLVLDQIGAPPGHLVETQELLFRGLCPNCVAGLRPEPNLGLTPKPVL